MSAMRAKKAPKPELPEIHCPGCGQKVEYRIVVTGQRHVPESDVLELMIAPEFDHACPPQGDDGLPMEVAA